MIPYDSLFKKYDPPSHGWARFSQRLYKKQRRQWVQWLVVPAFACMLVFVLLINHSRKDAGSLFLQKAMASDILFYSPAAAFSSEVPVSLSGRRMKAVKVYDTPKVAVFEVRME